MDGGGTDAGVELECSTAATEIITKYVNKIQDQVIRLLAAGGGQCDMGQLDT